MRVPLIFGYLGMCDTYPIKGIAIIFFTISEQYASTCILLNIRSIMCQMYITFLVE